MKKALLAAALTVACSGPAVQLRGAEGAQCFLNEDLSGEMKKRKGLELRDREEVLKGLFAYFGYGKWSGMPKEQSFGDWLGEIDQYAKKLNDISLGSFSLPEDSQNEHWEKLVLEEKEAAQALRKIVYVRFQTAVEKVLASHGFEAVVYKPILASDRFEELIIDLEVLEDLEEHYQIIKDQHGRQIFPKYLGSSI